VCQRLSHRRQQKAATYQKEHIIASLLAETACKSKATAAPPALQSSEHTPWHKRPQNAMQRKVHVGTTRHHFVLKLVSGRASQRNWTVQERELCMNKHHGANAPQHDVRIVEIDDGNRNTPRMHKATAVELTWLTFLECARHPSPPKNKI